MIKSSFIRKALWSGLAALLIAYLVYSAFFTSAERPENAPGFPKAALTLHRADGQVIPLTVEVATTPEQDTYGLMFRKTMPEDAGMIFLYDNDHIIRMWMKNTIMPLDMLFVRNDGTITKIVTHARPFDLTPISSDVPSRAVIEINAGAAEHFGLRTGDKVEFQGLSGPG